MQLNHFEPRAARQGGVLVLALVVVTVVGLMATSFMHLNAAATKRQGLAVDKKLAFYVAEAGLAESYNLALTGFPAGIGTGEDPARYGDGLVWVSQTELSDGSIQLESTGFAGSAQATLTLVVSQGALDPAQYGIFTNQDLTLPAGTIVGGYDSAELDPRGAREEALEKEGEAAEKGETQPIGGGGGADRGFDLPGARGWSGRQEPAARGTTGVQLEGPPPAVETEAIFAKLGSNGNVIIQSTSSQPTSVFAEVTVGPEGAVSEVGSPLVEGNTVNAASAKVFPAIDFPGMERTQSVMHTSTAPMVLDSGQHAFDTVTLTTGSVTLAGPLTLECTDFFVIGDTELVIDESAGPVEIFVHDRFGLTGGTTVTQLNESPLGFTLKVGGSQPVPLQGSGQIFGSVYAPNATVQLSASMEIHGSLVADAMSLTAGATFRYDNALGIAAIRRGLPQVRSWRIVEVDEARDEVIATAMRDITRIPRVSEILSERDIVIRFYRRRDDNPQTYAGLLEDFLELEGVAHVDACQIDGRPLNDDELARLNARIRERYMGLIGARLEADAAASDAETMEQNRILMRE